MLEIDENFHMKGTVIATSTIYITDFGIQLPNLANIAISQNKVLVTLNFTAKEAGGQRIIVQRYLLRTSARRAEVRKR